MIGKAIRVSILLCSIFLLLTAGLTPAQSQTQPPALRGVVTDPSGSAVPGALIQLLGPGGEQRQTAGANGQYSFPSVPPGKYQVRFIAKGFSVSSKQAVEINGPLTLDMQLSIEATAQVVDVQDEANHISIDPTENGDALILGDKQLDALVR